MLFIKRLIRKKPKVIKRIKGVNFVDGFIDDDGIYHPIKGEEKIKIPSEKSDEFKMAVWIKENLGGRIDMVPEIETAKGAKKVSHTHTPDYIWNGEKWDLKTLKNASSKTRAIDNLISNSEKQSHNFIVDITYCKLDVQIIMNQIFNVFRENKLKREWVEKIYLVKDEILLRKFNK